MGWSNRRLGTRGAIEKIIETMHNLYSRSNKSNNINSLIIPMRFFAILIHFLAVIIASANPSVRIEPQEGGLSAKERLKGGLLLLQHINGAIV